MSPIEALAVAIVLGVLRRDDRDGCVSLPDVRYHDRPGTPKSDITAEDEFHTLHTRSIH